MYLIGLLSYYPWQSSGYMLTCSQLVGLISMQHREPNFTVELIVLDLLVVLLGEFYSLLCLEYAIADATFFLSLSDQ